MKERERILELVKKGILSTEEALVLLENLDINKEHNDRSSATGELQDDMTMYTETEIEEEKSEETQAFLSEITTEIESLQTEIQTIRERLAYFTEEMTDLSEEQEAEKQNLEATFNQLEAHLENLVEQKDQLTKKLQENAVQAEQRDKEQYAEPAKKWKKIAGKTMNQIGEGFEETGTQLGKFLKQTFKTVADNINENVEWKETSLKIPKVASTQFSHTFTYENCEASLLDIKVANGKLNFQTWDQPDLKIEAQIKVHGKLSEEEAFNSFMERANVQVDDEKILFHVPNKRVSVKLDFYLPNRRYDYASFKILNGNMEFHSLRIHDVSIKSTHGDLSFENVEATMIEIEGVNGNIDVKEGSIHDLLIESVNGDVTIVGGSNHSKIALVNGTIKLTGKNEAMKKIELSNKNGAIKVSLPKTLGLEGKVKVNVGAIKNRLSNVEILQEKREQAQHALQIQRLNEENMLDLKIKSNTGSVFLKDFEDEDQE